MALTPVAVLPLLMPVACALLPMAVLSLPTPLASELSPQAVLLPITPSVPGTRGPAPEFEQTTAQARSGTTAALNIAAKGKAARTSAILLRI